MGVVVSNIFIDVVQYWIGQKEQLPAQYHMVMDFLGTPITLTPSERVNRAADWEFSTAHQSLSSDIFTKTMCIRSWMKADAIKIPADRQKAMLSSLKAQFPDAANDEVVSSMEVEQEECVEEVLDDSALGVLNTQFDQVFAEELDS
jgi:hAT family C-terminal dimerisation region